MQATIREQRISPDDLHHDALETSVKAFLEERTYLVPQAITYHASLEPTVATILKTRYSSTALYLRTRADRLAIHPTLNIDFEFECKTCQSYPDLAFEALPFVHHLLNSELGVRCLYALKNLATKRDYGFWATWAIVNDLRELRMPSGFKMDSPEVFTAFCKTRLPNVPIKEGASAGSRDPFFVIDRRTVIDYPNWTNLILDLMDDNPAATDGKHSGPDCRMVTVDRPARPDVR